MISLAPYNTLRVNALAQNFLELNTLEDIKKLDISKSFVFLGMGANVLFTRDFPGTVVKVNFSGIKIVKETKDEVFVECAAGQNWHDLVTWAVNNNYSGIENMALIPGTVGAAVIGNIAAYGQNQEDIFDSLQAYNLQTGETEFFDKNKCAYGYRESIFKHSLKNKYLITSVVYRLSKTAHLETSYHATRHSSLLPTLQKIAKEPYTINDIYHAIIKMRTEKLPDMQKIGSAGSFFKNPIITKDEFADISAKIPDLLAYPINKLQYIDPSDSDKYVKLSIARVLDELGWRGKIIGHVSTSPNHALYVVNLGGASGQEIFAYSENMRQDVLKNFSIPLEYEVQII